LGVHRTTIKLQRQQYQLGAIIKANTLEARDVSKELTKVAVQFLNNHSNRPLCGFIFKSRSPSCGLGSTPVQNQDDLSDGLFAQAIRQQHTSMALVEESWLINEARYWRFLSACYLLFHHNYGGGITRELLDCLDLEFTDADSPTHVSNTVAMLLANDEQAALEERLVALWRS